MKTSRKFVLPYSLTAYVIHLADFIKANVGESNQSDKKKRMHDLVKKLGQTVADPSLFNFFILKRTSLAPFKKKGLAVDLLTCGLASRVVADILDYGNVSVTNLRGNMIRA